MARPPLSRIILFAIVVTLSFTFTNRYVHQIYDHHRQPTLAKPIIKTFENIQSVVNYVNEANSSACKSVQEFGGVMNPTMGMDGQKTVCLDVGISPVPGNCLVYSFGINNEWSFDDAMEKYGCRVFAFDPSMNQQDHQHSKGVRFYNMGISGADIERNVQGWKLKTLSSIRKMLKHENTVIDYLKIDVEDSEWAAFEHMLETGDLKTVKQLAVEVHLFNCKGRLECFQRQAGILQRIENQGLLRYTSRQNPWSWDKVVVPNRTVALAQEIMWINVNYAKPL